MIYSLDIGGSSIKHALIDPQEKPGCILKLYDPLPLNSHSFIDLQNQLVHLVENVLSENKFIETIAISTTGSVNGSGIVINAGHFEGYSNISWETILKKKFRGIKQVLTINDGNASALAEFAGLNQEIDCFTHFVVGTGIGGAIVIDNKIFKGHAGYAGYLGHIKVTEENTAICSCGNYGCVETVASAPAIIRSFTQLEGIQSASEITLQDVVFAADNNNNSAKEALTKAGEYLGIAVSSVMNILNPGIVTIGGGVILATAGKNKDYNNPFFLSAIRSALFHAHKRVSTNTAILPAEFGNNGGIIGAAIYAKSSMTENIN